MPPPIQVEHVTYTAQPCPIGAEVTVPDGRAGKVLAYSNEQGERVIEFDDTSRGCYESKELRLVRMPPPPPEIVPRTGPLFVPENAPPTRDSPTPAWNRKSPAEPDGGGRARQGPATIVQGDFRPEDFPGFSGRVGGVSRMQAIVLDGGPYDGVEQQVPRGKAEHSLPMPHPEPGPGRPDFVLAIYKRTGRLDEDGLPVYAFVEPAEPAVA